MLYDTQTGKLIRRLEELHRQLPYFNRAPVTLTPDRRHLLVCAGKRLLWWNLEKCRVDHEYRFSSQLTALAISRDGKRFAVAGSAEYKCPHPIHVWDLEADRMTSMEGHDINIAMLTFSPDGSRLFSGHPRYTVQWDGQQRRFPGLLIEWDPATGRSIRSHEHNAERIELSPDGNTWCFYFESMSCDLFDWKQQQNIVSIKNVEQFHFSPDGSILALGGNEKLGSFWDARTGKEICKFQTHVELGTTPVCFSDDGKTLATRECSGDDRSGGSIRLWNVATGAELCPNPFHRGPIDCVAYSPDGRFIVSAGTDRRLLWWDAATGKLVGEFLAPNEPPHRDLRRKYVDFLGHIDGVVHLRFSGDGRFLASASFDRLVVWDVAARKIVHSQRPGGGSNVADIALNRVGSELCVMESDGAIRTWDVSGNKLKSVFKVFNHKIGGTRIAVFSPNGTYLAVPETDENDIQIWHVAQQKLIRSMPIADSGSANSESLQHFCVRLAFSPDSRYIAGSINRTYRWRHSKGYDESRTTIAVWDLAGGGKTLSIRDIGSSPPTMAFSPDGRALLHDLNDRDRGSHYYYERNPVGGRTAVLRDLTVGVDLVHHKGQGPANVCETTGWELPVIRGAMESAGRVAFAPDGKTLASVDVNRTLLVWDRGSLLPSAEPSAAKMTAEELAKAWEAFAEPVSPKVYPAIWRMTDDPAATLAFLKARLKTETALEPARVKQLLRALDNEAFSIRAEAMRTLERHGDLVEPMVRAELARTRETEHRRRLESLLTRLDDDQRPEHLQMRRGIEVLERLDHPAARELLTELARGVNGARITREASAALERRQP